MIDSKSWLCEDCGVPLGTIEYHNSIPTLKTGGILIIGEAEMMCGCGHVQCWHPNAAALSLLFKNRKIRQAAIREKLNELDRLTRG